VYPFAAGELPGSLVSGADVVVAEPDGRVLERVHDYRVGHGLVAELEEEGRVSGDVMRRCPGSTASSRPASARPSTVKAGARLILMSAPTSLARREESGTGRGTLVSVAKSS
jgi:hypothetical protein